MEQTTAELTFENPEFLSHFAEIKFSQINDKKQFSGINFHVWMCANILQKWQEFAKVCARSLCHIHTVYDDIRYTQPKPTDYRIQEFGPCVFLRMNEYHPLLMTLIDHKLPQPTQ